MSNTRVCTKCGETKPLSEFWISRSGINGRYSWCIECAKERDKVYKKRYLEKKRISPVLIHSRTVDEPYKALATAVLFQAVITWKRKHTGRAFFRSQWCEILCDLARVEYPAMIEALKIE